jgi:signal recognition particle receptor subunit beta
MDLFTALPANLVKLQLEKAITEVRTRRAVALRDAGAALGGGQEELDEEKEWLGEGGDGSFEFAQMQDVGMSVEVRGGNVIGKEGSEVKEWWEWVGELL